MGKYFGTDGIRGKANSELTVKTAFKVGQALGNLYTKQKIVIGMDTRISSGMLKNALCAGLSASGAEAYDMNVVPTPTVAYITANQDFICGVMISASHNPYYDNGIKIFNHQGVKIDEQIEAKIEAYLDEEYTIPYNQESEIGKIINYPEGMVLYADYLLSLFPLDLSHFRIAIDAANGSASHIAYAILNQLRAQCFIINNTPDGLNINHLCGSTHPEALQKFTLENKCDIGLAFDGDADRLIVVDHQGHLVNGDKMLYMNALAMQAKGQLNQDTIVTTVMANLGLFKALQSKGIHSEITQVGDKYVYDKMQNAELMLGGEQSGHIIFKHHMTTGDGLLSALKCLEIMLESKLTLEELGKDCIIYPQYLKNIRVNDKLETINNPKITQLVSSIETALGSDGRILVRPSGTEPLIRVMVEAVDFNTCTSYVNQVIQLIIDEGLSL